MNIELFVTTTYATIYLDQSLRTAVEVIEKQGLDGILVLNREGSPCGILTPVIIALNGNPNRQACDAMAPLLSIPVDTSIQQALQLFRDQCLSFAAVCDKNQNLIGTLSEKRLLQHLFEMQSRFIEIWELSSRHFPNIQQVFGHVLDTLQRHLQQVDLAFIISYQNGQCRLRSSHGIPAGMESQLQVCANDGVCQRIMQTSEIMVVQDARQQPCFQRCHIYRLTPFVSFLGIPLSISEREILGVLGVASRQPNAFVDADIKLASIFAYRVSSELDREERMLQLLHHDRLARMGTLIGGITHDFNNVMQILISSIDFLSKSISNSDPHQELIQAILQAIKHASSFSNNLLRFIRHGTPHMQAVQAAEMLERIAVLLKKTFPPEIRITVDCQPDLPVFQADPVLLFQAILNCCLNARDAMPQGGNLILRCYRQEVQKQNCSGNYNVIIEIEDSGCGIPLHLQKHILEPFFTSKESGQGTGLGLSVVQEIVRQHSGTLSFESQPGRTCFTMALPLITETPPATQDDVSVVQGHERLLLIEDNEHLNVLMQRLLRDNGYSVRSFFDGRKALEYLQTRHENFDLVILDYNLPSVSIETLIAEIKKHNARQKILMISGMITDERMERILNNGTCGFLQKPYDNQTLLTKLRLSLQDRLHLEGSTHN